MIKVTKLKGFKADLARISAHMEISSNLVVKKLAFEAFHSVIAKTPVDTGFAQNGWTIVGQGEGYFIGNNVPYILALENGHSKQSDKGYMITRTLNELESNFEKLVRSVGAK